MKVRCSNCGRENEIPTGSKTSDYSCHYCKKPLAPSKGGETSTAVGLVGGALLGAAIAGPIGAIIGGIFGAIIGNEAKGLDK